MLRCGIFGFYLDIVNEMQGTEKGFFFWSDFKRLKEDRRNTTKLKGFVVRREASAKMVVSTIRSFAVSL